MTFGPYDEPPADPAGDVVLALVPLADALPIAWDRYLRNRLRHPYPKWLEAVFADPPEPWPTVRSFWQHHHYDALAERWRAAVGERLVVSVVSVAAAPATTRPPLPAAAAEVVRRVNAAFHHRDWPVDRYDQVVRRGLLPALAAPAATATATTTPAWAIEHANEIAAADAARIASSGIRVAGDLAALSGVPVPAGTAHDGPPEAPHALPVDAAAEAVVATVTAVAATWPR
ncbi:MAG TPA: hypothetical protein VG899_15835 [Mycobacteriales bacterium]|nr:hypothetical protein [Mycobacteriales bacterium]